MKRNKAVASSIWAALLLCGGAQSAFAQPVAPPPASAPSPTDTAPPTPPAPSAPSAAPPAPSAPPPATAAAPADEKKPEPAATKWYDDLKLGAFADVYGSLNVRTPIAPRGNPAAGTSSNTNRYRAFDTANGFALSWVGLNAEYSTSKVGALVQLRFGPSTNGYAVVNDLGVMQVIKQAVATWKPTEKLSFDLGKFDTLYGLEVGDSQGNFNYTRGALYNLGQPFFHTGFKVNYTPIKQLELKAMVVNGWNNTIDNNSGKSFGFQVGILPTDTLAIRLGYITGPEQNENATVTTPEVPATPTTPAVPAATVTTNVDGANTRWRHFIDLLVTANPTKELSLALNGDYMTEKVAAATGGETSISYYGALLAARYQLTDMFAVAARGELIKDPDGFLTAVVNPTTGGVLDATLVTGTLTLEAAPTPNFIIRLDSRVDAINGEAFQVGSSRTATNQITETLGVVVKTN
jgi:hypothetical protein